MSEKKGSKRFAEMAQAAQAQQNEHEDGLSALLVPPKKKNAPKKHIVNAHLDAQLVDTLDKIASRLGLSRTELLSQVLTQYVELERKHRPELLQ
ncbi:MAG: ribbon-helix-helix protein, CopG family [Acidobacterium ailaaui]|nr:ribbon-helix-helix protein, CopG family [Pseudacidobacterium ailaaui]